jgi:hypothetical protein
MVLGTLEDVPLPGSGCFNSDVDCVNPLGPTSDIPLPGSNDVLRPDPTDVTYPLGRLDDVPLISARKMSSNESYTMADALGYLDDTALLSTKRRYSSRLVTDPPPVRSVSSSWPTFCESAIELMQDPLYQADPQANAAVNAALQACEF